MNKKALTSYTHVAVPVENIEKTVKWLLDMMFAGKIILSPEYQRNFVARPKWSKKIVISIWNRKGVNTLHLRDLGDGTYEVLDGLQRLQSIFLYINGKISLTTPKGADGVYVPMGNSETYRKISLKGEHLTDADKQAFYDSVIATSIYNSAMTDIEAADKFVELNDGNDLKDQEKRNGLKGFYTSMVRSIVNPDTPFDELGTSLHPFFEVFKLRNDRRQAEELVAKLAAASILYNENLSEWFLATEIDRVLLDEQYESTPGRTDLSECKKTYKTLKEILDQMLKIVNSASDEKMAKKSFSSGPKILFAFEFLLYLKAMKLEIVDFKAFADTYVPTMYSMFLDQETTYEGRQKSRLLVTWSGMLGLHLKDQIFAKIGIFLNAITVDGEISGVVGKRVRCFSEVQILNRFEQQGKRCAIEGAPVFMKDIEGGHIISHANGGDNGDDNLIVITKEVNRKMGRMNLDEFLMKYGEEYPNHLCRDIVERMAAKQAA